MSDVTPIIDNPSSSVKVYETTVTLPTYPFRDYLFEEIDPRYNIPVLYLNRTEYEAASPQPIPQDYVAVVLENDYLRLTFLPELGGRLYSVVVKTRGQEIFYHNPVIKPSPWGGLHFDGRHGRETNWWLAMGGMEWAYPIQEHGYRWGVAWDYAVRRTATGATITLSDMALGRVGVSVEVTLSTDRATFTVTPRLTNAGVESVPVQFWLNAALTLASHSLSSQTRFILPAESITIHSRGADGWTIPDAQEIAPWPVVNGTDLSQYEQWANYLGFFLPYVNAPFVGAYNPETDLGIIRLMDTGIVPGSKVFAFSSSFPDRRYTDDGSQYFELWGGINPDFWPQNDVWVDVGETIGWQEQWWPVAGLGGLTWATDAAAIRVSQVGQGYTLGVMFPQSQRGRMKVLRDNSLILDEAFLAQPSEVLQWSVTGIEGSMQVEIGDDVGRILLTYHW